MPTPFPPEGAPSPDDSITPGRQTRAVFDVPEDILVEDEIVVVRRGTQVSPLAARDSSPGSRFKDRVRFWKCGAWTLEPLQAGDFQEKTPTTPFVYQPPASGGFLDLLMAFVANYAQLPIFQKNPGVLSAYATNVQSSGDPFYQREIDDNDPNAWQTSVLTVPAPYAATQDAIPNKTAPLGFIGHSIEMARADQGFCLRFSVPGTQAHHPDIIGGFHFGGTEGGTQPQYCLVLLGDGQCSLYEYARTSASGGYGWGTSPVFTFRYCRPAQVCNQTHKILIFPLVGPNGEKFITFAGASLDGNETASAGVLAVAGSAGTDAGASSMTEYVYQWNPAVAGTLDGSPGHATGAGRFYLSERIDLRNLWQVSKLTFQITGRLIDQPIDLLGAREVRDFEYYPVQSVPPTTNPGLPFQLGAQIKRGTAPNRGDVVAQSGGGNPPLSVYLDFTFKSDTTDTPVLWGFTFRLPAAIEHIEPGEFECPVKRANVSGADSDPQQENAHVVIDDVMDEFQRLRNRGQLSFRLQTLTAPIEGNSDTFPVVLFRGRANRPHGTKWGRKNSATPNARSYDCTVEGIWERLQRKTFRKAAARAALAVDNTAPADANGVVPPWKVTKAIEYLLGIAGFLPSQIRIDDNPIRLYPGIGAPPSDLTIDHRSDVASLIVAFARNFLGQYLHFAPNDGPLGTDGVPVGQWILIAPPLPDAEPVWNFVSAPPDVPIGSGGTPALHMLASYGEKTAYTMDALEGYTAPPEANHVIVLTPPDIGKAGGLQFANEAHNFKSYAVPGSSIVPDPDSPHYLGYHSPVVVPDATLWGDGTDGLTNMQAAVDFMVVRELTYACLPRRIRTVHAALVFILDAETNRRRPLRLYDKVTFNGEEGWFVRNVDPVIEHDLNQTAVYELERTIGLQED